MKNHPFPRDGSLAKACAAAPSLKKPIPSGSKLTALFNLAVATLLASTGIAHAAIIALYENDTTDAAFYDGSINPTDLANSGQATFTSVTTTSPTTVFGIGGINNGTGGNTAGDGAFWVGSNLPTTVTTTLDVTTNPLGYDIHLIRSIAGFPGNGQAQSNQGFELLTRQVGAVSFVSHGQFDNVPFTPGLGTPALASTRTTLTDSTGTIASGIEQIQFVLIDHGFTTGSFDGTFYREIDIEGVATTAIPEPSRAMLLLLGLVPLAMRRR